MENHLPDPVENARQRSVRHFLGGDVAWSVEDVALKALAVRAQQVFVAEFFAINIFDGDLQRSVLGAPGVPVHVTRRAVSLCDRVLSHDPQMRLFATADASVHTLLADSPWVNFEWAAIRFYASAPLRDSNGFTLGAVCVWSDRVMQPDAYHLSQLVVVRNEVMRLLEGRGCRG